MTRPKIPRFCRCRPCACFFKPRGVPLRDLEEVELKKDEFESIKLHDVDNLDQENAARKMRISQPTFARIIDSAYKKIAKSLVLGKAIKIEK